jgi:hypothetical protein
MQFNEPLPILTGKAKPMLDNVSNVYGVLALIASQSDVFQEMLRHQRRGFRFDLPVALGGGGMTHRKGTFNWEDQHQAIKSMAYIQKENDEVAPGRLPAQCKSICRMFKLYETPARQLGPLDPPVDHTWKTSVDIRQYQDGMVRLESVIGFINETEMYKNDFKDVVHAYKTRKNQYRKVNNKIYRCLSRINKHFDINMHLSKKYNPILHKRIRAWNNLGVTTPDALFVLSGRSMYKSRLSKKGLENQKCFVLRSNGYLSLKYHDRQDHIPKNSVVLSDF